MDPASRRQPQQHFNLVNGVAASPFALILPATEKDIIPPVKHKLTSWKEGLLVNAEHSRV